jgi:hypothetical protein
LIELRGREALEDRDRLLDGQNLSNRFLGRFFVSFGSFDNDRHAKFAPYEAPTVTARG